MVTDRRTVTLTHAEYQAILAALAQFEAEWEQDGQHTYHEVAALRRIVQKWQAAGPTTGEEE
jgi:hypothetical protein